MAAPTEPRVCSIARTLEVVGEKWALLAVREVFLGNRRFDEMVRRTGAPRDVDPAGITRRFPTSW
jgi:DNA-binding HxlR family transcriptional regulator